VFSFYERATGLPFKESIDKLALMAGCLPDRPARREEAKKELRLPDDLHAPTAAESKQIARLRGLGPEGVQIAADRGLLRCGSVCGVACWLVLDRARRSAQARRLDGLPFMAAGGLGERKAHTLKGSSQAWPVGVLEAVSLPFIALVEGGPDMLAALHFAKAEGLADRVGVVAMLGASNKIPEEALHHFRGKRVRIFPHADRAGMEAARRWEKQLRRAGAVTDCFSVDGIPLQRIDDCEPVRYAGDLNDIAFIDADAFETDREMWEIMDAEEV
jgi:hypothetical protein